MKVMKKISLILLVFSTLFLITCKKAPKLQIYELLLNDELIEYSENSVRITVSYSYPTKLEYVNAYVSQSVNFDNSTTIKSEVNDSTFVVNITDLQPDIKYYYKYEYSNGINVVKSDVKNFTIDVSSLTLPTVTTNPVTNITTTTATCGGVIVNDGGYEILEKGICWSTSHNPTISSNHIAYEGDGNSFTINMTELEPNTTYYVKAYATNETGTGYGNEKTFKTLDAGNEPTSIPTVIVESVLCPTATSATINVNITDTGGGIIYERGIVYYTSESDSLVTVTKNSNEEAFSVELQNLDANLYYYVKGYATNSLGTGYSEIFMFAPGRPILDIEVTNITKTSITVKTKITNNNSTITEKGICYGQTDDLTYYSDEHIAFPGQENEFSININNLVSGGKYYIRSYAICNGELNYSTMIDTVTVYPWYYKTTIPGLPRTQQLAFAIGKKAYIGTGVYQNDMFLDDIWEYDTENDVWTQKANYPEGCVRNVLASAVNGKGYAGLGFKRNGTNEGERLFSFYEYDPVSNMWTRKQDYQGDLNYDFDQCSFVMNDKVCFATTYRYGEPGACGGALQIYQFNTDTGRWNKLTEYQHIMYYSFDGYGSIAVNAIGSDIYCYMRYRDGNWGNELKTFFKYETEFDMWIEKECPPVPITYSKMENFVMGDNFYLFSGRLYAGVHNMTTYKYWPETNTWTENDISEPKIFRYNPVNLMIDGKLYYGGGDNNGNQSDIWVYDPSLE